MEWPACGKTGSVSGKQLREEQDALIAPVMTDAAIANLPW